MRKNQMLLGLCMMIAGAIILAVMPNDLPEKIRQSIIFITVIIGVCAGATVILYGWVNEEKPKKKEVKENEIQTQAR